HYERYNPVFHLVDLDGISDDVRYGFRDNPSNYASLEGTRRFLLRNGLNETQIKTVDIGTQPFPREPKFDLVVSLISWGFHYPVDTYLEDVTSSLAPHGTLILDLRRGSGGIEQ